MGSYIYIAADLKTAGTFDSDALPNFTERHHFQLPAIPLGESKLLKTDIRTRAATGVLFGLATGLPSRAHLRLARFALKLKRAVYLYWPAEHAVEVVDFERLGSFWRHWIAYQVAKRAVAFRAKMRTRQTAAPVAAQPISGPIGEQLEFFAADYASTKAHILGALPEIRDLHGAVRLIESGFNEFLAGDRSGGGAELGARIAQVRERVANLETHLEQGEVALDRGSSIIAGLIDTLRGAQLAGAGVSEPTASSGPAEADLLAEYGERLSVLRSNVAPVAFPRLSEPPSPAEPLAGTGVYFRTDYWVQLISGGSYGHTCYVARELARTTAGLMCFMGSHYPLLDELGLTQEVLRPPLATATELDWIKADQFYYEALRARMENIRPAYIYERLCPGNFAAARVSRDLGIPYIVEYNGSEFSMRRSFGAGAFAHEDLFLQAEELAFRQATAITVVSEHVARDVIERGIDPTKLVVNPNGVDIDEYRAGTAAERQKIRAELGLPSDAPVIAFVGTFGGWHGIDVLAAAMPEICRAAPEARFLLIGDGHLKPLVLDAIRKHELGRMVVDVGRTEQRVGARCLKAADIFVAPHSSHMHDRPFFGSPTKLFEYMAVGGAIVASDLEQLGEVVSPAFRPQDLADGPKPVIDQRGILCKPGDVGEFVAGVLALIRHPDLARELGRNARAAAEAHYSWTRHVQRIWRHIAMQA